MKINLKTILDINLKIIFKYSAYILLLFSVLFLLTGCYSAEDKKLASEYRKQGKANAISYINEKYGFKTKIKYVSEDANISALWGGLDSSPNGKVTVKMNANGRDFLVHITGTEKSNDGIDDYQMKDIENDLINYLKKIFSVSIYDYSLSFTTDGFQEYYDNNIEYFMPYINSINLYFINQNNLESLNLDKLTSLFETYHDSINLINFDSKEKYENFKNQTTENVSLIDIDMFDIFKHNSIRLSKEGKEYHDYTNKISNYDDELYIFFTNSKDKCEIINSELSDISNYKNIYPNLPNMKIKQVTKAFKITKPSSSIYIYFPKDKININSNDDNNNNNDNNKTKKKNIKNTKNTNNEDIFFIYEGYVNGEKKYNIELFYGEDGITKLGSIGDYYFKSEKFYGYDDNTEITISLVKISNYNTK